MLKKLPIDALLRWAVRDELPKGKPIARSAWDSIFSYSKLGTRIQHGRRPDNDWGPLPDTPHPDAEVIAATLRGQPQAMSVTAVECRELLGHYAALDPRAISSIAGASFNPVRLMISAANNRNGYAWDCGQPRAQVLRHSNNNAIVFGFIDGVLTRLKPTANGSFRFADEPRAFVQYTSPTVVELLEARVEYTIWHRGLCDLAEVLHGKMQEHEALPPSLPATPWLCPSPATTVFTNETPPLARLPLKPARGAPLAPSRRSAKRGDSRLTVVAMSDSAYP